MRVPPFIYIAPLILLVCAASAAAAQHDGHTMSPPADSATVASTHIMVQAIPLATRAEPTAGDATATQVVVSQLMAMVRSSFAGGRATLAASLDGEGLTMPNGELNTGAYGEGFVDRRHPHTYVHELMLSAQELQLTCGGRRLPAEALPPSRLSMLTAGVRLRLADAHARMGRHGVADVNDVVIGSMAPAGITHHH